MIMYEDDRGMTEVRLVLHWTGTRWLHKDIDYDDYDDETGHDC